MVKLKYLDLRVFPDWGHRVLDKNEYNYHRKKMKYPKEIDLIVEKELKKLIQMKKDRIGPFDEETIKKYHHKYDIMKKEGII